MCLGCTQEEMANSTKKVKKLPRIGIRLICVFDTVWCSSGSYGAEDGKAEGK